MIKKLIALLFLINGYSCSGFLLKEYQPLVYTNHHGLVQNKELFTETHRKNIIKVFEYYGVYYEIKGTQIFVNSNLNKELMWNYTTKANDSAWLATHIPQRHRGE